MQSLLLATSLLFNAPADVEKVEVTTDEVSQFVNQQVKSTSKKINFDVSKSIKNQSTFYKYKMALAVARTSLINEQSEAE